LKKSGDFLQRPVFFKILDGNRVLGLCLGFLLRKEEGIKEKKKGIVW
jgi:hypothetical protein